MAREECRMQDYYFVYRSVTRAQVGAAVLADQNIWHQLQRAPRAITAQGCGYALRVREPLRAARSLRLSGAAFERAYTQGGGGAWEEVSL